MAITRPFDSFSPKYEEWFIRYRPVYDSEVEALRTILPDGGGSSLSGLEIGVGSGLFASRLGVARGVDPSEAMLRLAEKRGIEVKQGVAEELPYRDGIFDYTLMVTAICFLEDIEKAIGEIRRVLKDDGRALFGFVDEDSPLGRSYLKHKDENVFYRDATFYTAQQVISLLEAKNFEVEMVRQTVFGKLDEVREIQPSKEGHGEGGFVVIRARKRDGQ